MIGLGGDRRSGKVLPSQSSAKVPSAPILAKAQAAKGMAALRSDWHELCDPSSDYIVMNSHTDPIVVRQLPHIARIIQDEAWLEGERRGCPVSNDDQVVVEKVCDVVLRVGAELRTQLSDQWNTPSVDAAA